MSGKFGKCVPQTEAKAFEKLVDMYEGDQVAAFAAFEENGNTVPDEAKAMVSADLYNNDVTLQDITETDPLILSKKRALNKIKALLDAKLKRLTTVLERQPQHKGLIKGQAEVQAIMDKIDEVEIEETLIDFIQAADNMTQSAKSWMDKFDSGERQPSLDNLKRIEDYISSFSVLKDLSAEMLDMEQHKDIFDKVEAIMGRANQVHNRYIVHARNLIAEGVSGNFHKVRRMHEKNAEHLFIKYKKPHLTGTKEEIREAQAEYVGKHMISNATEIDQQTVFYIHNLLLQTVDIPTLTAWAVNPKDMNNDIVSLALDSLEEADMNIWNEMEDVVDTSEYHNERFIKWAGKKGDPKKQYEIFFTRDENGELEDSIISRSHPDFVEFKDKYENVPEVWDLFNHMHDLIAKKDKMVFGNNKLGTTLPFLEKDNFERLYSQGPLHLIREGFKDKIKIRNKDVELGNASYADVAVQKRVETAHGVEEVYLDQSGDERSTIPLYYRNRNIDKADRSWDVMGLLVLDYHNALRHKTKTETAVFLEALKDVVHEADIIQTTAGFRKLKVNAATGGLFTKRGKSNIEDTLEQLIRHRIYGIKYEGDPKVTKRLMSIGKYTSLLTMGVNKLSGAANFIHGSTMSWIETAGGKTGYFTAKDRAKAVAEYDKSLPAMAKDIGERVPKSKINLLVRRFNAFSEGHLLNGKSFTQNNRIKRLADQSALFAFNSSGEHAVQSVVMLSVLNNIKVKDVNGNFLDKNFKPTKNRNEAIGVGDAMFVNDENKLEFRPEVHSTERTKGIGQADMTQISRMIRRINRDLYGNYDSENVARYQRTAAGALMGQMRGWLVPGMQKRWRGIRTTSGMQFGEEFTFDNLHRLSYNTEIEDFEEGQYTTTIRFLRNMKFELRAMKLAVGPKDVWKTMDDQQKGRVRKTLVEAGVMIAALMLSMAFEGDEDDDKTAARMYAAYLSRRLYSELFTFASPKEAVRTFRSPAIAISSVENAIDFVIQMANPTEEYKTGRHAGEYKIWRKLKKLVPVVKQIDRNVEDSYLFLTR